MAKLIVVDGPETGAEHDLDQQVLEGRNLLAVGRDPRNELPLNDTAVSRRHFTLERVGRTWRIVDQGSRNSTYLNGKPVREAILADGDLIRAGDSELRFECPGELVAAGGVASTILKELPSARRKDTILERLASIEEALNRPGVPAPGAAGPAVARIARLCDAYGELAATNRRSDLCTRLAAEVLPALEADLCAVLLQEENGWTACAVQGRDQESGPIQVSEELLARAVEGRTAVLSKNVRRAGKSDAPVAGSVVTSVLVAPILAAGSPPAVVYVERREESGSPFGEGELELLTALVEPAGPLLAKVHSEDQLRQENQNLFRSLTDTRRIIGKSKATLEAIAFIQKAAPAPMTVLILGETGTGKELVAAAIHYSSPRKGKPFVAINCAALPENLVESELFGHERGAFTGAVTRRKGRFELADTGTIFLDEVGELSLACQAKLLRLLEERQFERVGGVDSVKIDVRVIAATNKDLLRAVSQGTFREDLYYRLSVLNLRLAPLRERKDDIPLLARHFLEACGTRKRLGKAAEERLLGYAWPGNVRQLRNVLESAAVLGEGSEIRPADLILSSAPLPSGGPVEWRPVSLGELERQHIERVLEHTGGNKKRAAEILGIERCTLYTKLKSYGLSPGKEGSDE